MARHRKMQAAGRSRPADQQTVRRHNLGLVLECITKGDRLSRAQVSMQTGLNPSTVSSLVGQLIEQELVYETGLDPNGAIGRPGRGLEINPDGGAALGIEIGDDGLGVIALDLAGGIRYRAFFGQDNVERDPRLVVKQASDLAREALSAFKKTQSQKMCTIALPGLIAPNGVLLEAPNTKWRHVPIQEYWREEVDDLPLLIDNEARLAAYAEMTLGVAQDLQTFIFVSGGTGIGSGVVIDRQIYRGVHGFAGEFGHTIIDQDGPTSSWGYPGSVQTLAGERALQKMAGIASVSEGPHANSDWIAREVARRARDGDDEAIAAMEMIGDALGVGIANLFNLFDMQAVVLGGYFTHVREWVLESVSAKLQARVNAEHWASLEILFSDMGREAPVRGAAAWSLHAILKRAGLHETGAF